MIIRDFRALALSAPLSFAACATPPQPPPMTHEHHTVDYVELEVTDVAAAKRFYGAAFDWTFQDYGPDYVGLRKPDGTEFGGMLLAEEVQTGGPLIVLFSTDLEASVRAVEDAGGTIVTPPFAFPGGRRFHFADPSGNELAVWSEE